MGWLLALLGLMTTFAVTRGGSSTGSTETIAARSNDRASDGSSAGVTGLPQLHDDPQPEEGADAEDPSSQNDEDFVSIPVPPVEDTAPRAPVGDDESNDSDPDQPDQLDDPAPDTSASDDPDADLPTDDDGWGLPDLASGQDDEPSDDLPTDEETVVLPPLPQPTPEPQPDASAAEEILNEADIFVATYGRDNGAGTLDDPVATIERAVAMARPGDTILVRGGTYEGPIHISQGGEEGAPVKIMGYPGERPIIDGSGTPPDTDLVLISDSHVHFEGFEVTGATRTGIAVWSTNDVTIADNVIHDAIRGGIWIGSDRLGVSYGHLVEGNDVFNTALENEAKVWDSGWPRAIAIDVSTDTIVRDNMVFKNYGEGLGGLSSSNLQYIDNIAYDNYSVQMYFDNTQNVTATGNVLFHTGDEEFFRDGEPGIGILIANEDTQYEMPTTGMLIRDNIFAGVEPVFYDDSYGWGGGISNSVLGPNDVREADDLEDDWLAPEALLV